MKSCAINNTVCDMIVSNATWNESGAGDKEFPPFFKLSVYMFTCNKDFLYYQGESSPPHKIGKNMIFCR